MNLPDIEIIPPMPKSNMPKSDGRQYGIYNHAEDRWEVDFWGGVFVFSNRAIAEAQCSVQIIRWYGHNPKLIKNGKELDISIEVIEFVDENYKDAGIKKPFADAVIPDKPWPRCDHEGYIAFNDVCPRCDE